MVGTRKEAGFCTPDKPLRRHVYCQRDPAAAGREPLRINTQDSGKAQTKTVPLTLTGIRPELLVEAYSIPTWANAAPPIPVCRHPRLSQFPDGNNPLSPFSLVFSQARNGRLARSWHTPAPPPYATRARAQSRQKRTGKRPSRRAVNGANDSEVNNWPATVGSIQPLRCPALPTALPAAESCAKHGWRIHGADGLMPKGFPNAQPCDRLLCKSSYLVSR